MGWLACELGTECWLPYDLSFSMAVPLRVCLAVVDVWD
jgi:hypothetical protein